MYISKYKHVEREHIWNATTVILGHMSELYLIHPDIIQIQKLTSSQIKIFLDKGLKTTTKVRKLCLKGLHETYKTFQCYLVKGKYHTFVEKCSNLAMMIQVNREPHEHPIPSNQYKLCGSQQEKDAYTISWLFTIWKNIRHHIQISNPYSKSSITLVNFYMRKDHMPWDFHVLISRSWEILVRLLYSIKKVYDNQDPDHQNEVQ